MTQARIYRVVGKDDLKSRGGGIAEVPSCAMAAQHKREARRKPFFAGRGGIDSKALATGRTFFAGGGLAASDETLLVASSQPDTSDVSSPEPTQSMFGCSPPCSQIAAKTGHRRSDSSSSRGRARLTQLGLAMFGTTSRSASTRHGPC